MKAQTVGKWKIYTGEVYPTYEPFFEKYHATEWKKYWTNAYKPKTRKNSKISHGWEVVFSAPQKGEFDDVKITRIYLVKKGNRVLIVNNNAFISREAIHWRKIWK